jgi:hypothetical protein
MGWSEEVRGLVRIPASKGVRYQVSSVCRPGRPQDSYHNRVGTNGCGQAVDFTGPTPFSRRVPHQPFLDIFYALAEHSDQLAELFYSGAPFFVKNGVEYDIALLSPAVKNGHWDHVHAAVEAGVVLVPATVTAGQGTIGGVNKDIIAFEVTPTGKGYWFVTADGAVYAFGDAEYFGGLEMDAQGFWQVRKG